MTPARLALIRARIAAWLRTTKDALAPVNPDGTSHSATCPQADHWRKAR